MNARLNIESRVVTALRTVLPKKNREQAVEMATTLTELDLDSLKFLEFLLALEEEFGMQLNEDMLKLQAVRTIGDAVALVASASGAGS